MSGDDNTNLKAKTVARPAKPVKMRSSSGLTGLFDPPSKSAKLEIKKELTRTAQSSASKQSSASGAHQDDENKTITATKPPVFLNGFEHTNVKPEKPQTSPRSNAALMILVLVGMSMAYILMNLESGKGSKVLSDLEGIRHKMSDRIEFHRTMTGGKLNQDRIKVQYENELTAPRIDSFENPKRKPDPVLSGVTLDQEPLYRDELQSKTLPINPDYADARVQYALEEEKFATDWEEQAQLEYIEEFKRNALAAGYAVKVDSKGRVIEVKPLKRNPADSGMFIAPDSRGSAAR